MSNSLIKRSLELVKCDTDVTIDKRKKDKLKSKGTLNLLPVNHRLIKKNKKKGSTLLLNATSNLTVFDAKKELDSKIDPTEENVRKLLILSNNTLNADVSKKILSRGVKKRYIIEEEKPVEEEKTVFTEEDFQKFEAEYFG